jgi:hypothetical protein
VHFDLGTDDPPAEDRHRHLTDPWSPHAAQKEEHHHDPGGTRVRAAALPWPLRSPRTRRQLVHARLVGVVRTAHVAAKLNAMTISRPCTTALPIRPVAPITAMVIYFSLRSQARWNLAGHQLKYEHLYRCEIEALPELAREAKTFRQVFNHVRPHEALDFHLPIEVHRNPALYPQPKIKETHPSRHESVPGS